MVKIRLARAGSRNQPTYRVVAIESRNFRDGKVLATLGQINPNVQPAQIVIDQIKINAWLARGAYLSSGVKKWLKT